MRLAWVRDDDEQEQGEQWEEVEEGQEKEDANFGIGRSMRLLASGFGQVLFCFG